MEKITVIKTKEQIKTLNGDDKTFYFTMTYHDKEWLDDENDAITKVYSVLKTRQPLLIGTLDFSTQFGFMDDEDAAFEVITKIYGYTDDRYKKDIKVYQM